MSISSLLAWVESTRLSIAIREGGLPYPIIGGIHLLSIALFGGALLATNLRLLGWAMSGRKVSDVLSQFRPWKWAGFAVVVITGLLLTWAEPIRLYKSPSFWWKMGIFGMVGVHGLVFQRGVYRHPENLDSGITRQAKVAAALSLTLWAGLIVAGRFIAFDPSFDE
jgi:hypothetical protein